MEPLSSGHIKSPGVLQPVVEAPFTGPLATHNGMSSLAETSSLSACFNKLQADTQTEAEELQCSLWERHLAFP